MTRLQFVDACITGFLTTGAASVALLTAGAAALIVATGYRAGTAVATRQQIRHGIRDLERQIQNPAVRAMYLDQDWEEKP